MAFTTPDRVATKPCAVAPNSRGTERAMKPISPRCVAANDAACKICSGTSSATGGSNAIAVQRRIAPAPPIAIHAAGLCGAGSRPDSANSTISAMTPMPHKTPISVPSNPAARHCTVENP